jgi:hypothetical protein
MKASIPLGFTAASRIVDLGAVNTLCILVFCVFRVFRAPCADQLQGNCAQLSMAAAELDQLQDGAGEGIANADAKRTLLRVKQKLEGLDGGEVLASHFDLSSAHLQLHCSAILLTWPVMSLCNLPRKLLQGASVPCTASRWEIQAGRQQLSCMGPGEGEAKSVEGQVQQLLQEAQDPDRLCRMFVGWASWL